jgi:signal transduction histidine kinase
VPRLAHLPIRWQLTAFYVGLLAFLLIAFGLLVYRQTDLALQSDTVSRLRDQVAQAWGSQEPLADLRPRAALQDKGAVPRPPPLPIPRPAAAPVGPGATKEVVPPAELRRAAAQLVLELNGRETNGAVYDLQGNLIARGEPFAGVPDWPAPSPEQLDVAGRGAQSVRVVADRTPRALLWVAPLTRADGRVVATVAVATSFESADEALASLRRILWPGVVLVSVAGAVAGVTLTRLLLRPLEQVGATAERIAAGDLSQRVGRSVPGLPARRDELGRLAAAFDHMVGRLATTLEAQRRFVADAAHELKTPLTAIGGMVEMLLMGADGGDPGARQRALRGIEREVGRLSRLVGDLLTLSQLDARAAPVPDGQVVDLAATAAGVTQQAQVLARGQTVAFVQEGGPLLVEGDPDRLAQVLLNLVDNAIKHTPPGGRVTVTARPAAGGGPPARRLAEVAVADTGAGIPAEALPHLFDRFYRADAARDRRRGGAGLGLAIAQGIARAYGGAITAASEGPGRGATFTLQLPLGLAGARPVPGPASHVPRPPSDGPDRDALRPVHGRPGTWDLGPET